MKSSKEEIQPTSRDLGMVSKVVSGDSTISFDSLEKIVFDLKDSLRGSTLDDFSVLLFVTSAILYAKEGMLCRTGLNPDLSKESTRYLLQIDNAIKDIWGRVVDWQKPFPALEPLNELAAHKFTQSETEAVFKSLLGGFYAGLRFDMFIQPQAVTDLMVGLLDYKGGSVYNPFAGVGSFAIALGANARYIGEEIDQRTHALGLMNLMVHGINPSEYLNEDSFQAHSKDRFDYIISTPPFNLRFREQYPFALHRFGDEKVRMASFSGEMNDYILLSSEARLKPEGKAVCLCSASVTYSARSADARKDLIERNLVDAIISLPGGLFPNTSLSATAVVLREGRCANEPVLLVDASHGYTIGRTVKQLDAKKLLRDIAGRNPETVKVITPDEIAEKDYSWLAAQYIRYDSSSLVDGYHFKRIADLTEDPKYCFMPIPETPFPEITAAVLTSSPYNFRVQPAVTDPTDPDYRRPSKNVRLMYTEPTFFVSTIGKPKFGFVQASEESPVYAADGFIGYRLKKEILPEYFAIKLSDRDLESFLVGTGIRRLRPKDLAEIQIAVPSLEEQEAVVKKMYAEHNVSLGREQELEQAMARMKKEFEDEKGMFQHNLATPAAQIKATCQRMQRELKDGNIEATNNLLKRQLLQIQNLLATVYSLENGIGFGEGETFNFDEYLSRYNEASYSDRFKITYRLDTVGLEEAELEPLIKVNGSAFMQAVMNIIRNADKHGFKDKDRTDYAIDIDVLLDPTGKFFRFNFSNNGNPLPEGMDAEKYGTKGESTGDGKGLGGYYVKKMAEAFGGSIEVRSSTDQTKGSRTTITIKLPVMEDEL